jgi:hypothetical protein
MHPSGSPVANRYADGDVALARKPQSKSKVQATIARPTLMKPAVTSFSCQGSAVRPGAVIGESAPVPKVAANTVKNQFT